MNSIYSVSQINSYITNMFAQDYLLKKVSVSGEVSNLKYHSSGHVYFSIKDEKSVLGCVMFSSNAKTGIRFKLSDGQKIVVTGRLGSYEKGGTYKLYASVIELAGHGELYLLFEKRKKELMEMGMFDESFKQPVPKYIKTLGVVTSPTSAAVRDIIHVCERRNPNVDIVIYPAYVQGEEAKTSIVKGIEALSEYGADVIIVGRGGGSIEDLWAFNEECVARAIFDCDVPVISAVGHETDFTIADFVADLRAPTPSAAAWLAVYDMNDFTKTVSSLYGRLTGIMEKRIVEHKHKTDYLKQKLDVCHPNNKLLLEKKRLNELYIRLENLSPYFKVLSCRQAADELYDRIDNAFCKKIDNVRHEIVLKKEKLDANSPYNRLNAGYSYVESEDGKNVNSVESVNIGEALNIYVKDGAIKALVNEKRGRET